MTVRLPASISKIRPLFSPSKVTAGPPAQLESPMISKSRVMVWLPVMVMTPEMLMVAQLLSARARAKLAWVEGVPPTLQMAVTSAWVGPAASSSQLKSNPNVNFIIFLIVAVITLFQFRYTKMWEEVGEGV